DQFGVGFGEEKKDESCPYYEVDEDIAIFFLPPAPALQNSLRYKERPGEHGQKKYRNEEPERLVTAVNFGQKTLKMFVDEEKLEKLRVAKGNQNKPWCCDEQKERYAGQKAHLLQKCPATADKKVEEDYPAGENQADEPLCQDCQCGKNIEQVVVITLASFIRS